MTFSLDRIVDGNPETIELVPGGASISVTNENRADFVRRVVNMRFFSGIQQQMSSIRRGFFALVGMVDLEDFTSADLELLLCGVYQLNVAAWKEATVYENGYSERDQVICHFWQVVEDMDDGQRSKLLQFVTGTSRLPAGDFRALQGMAGQCPFSIYKHDIAVCVCVFGLSNYTKSCWC